MITPRRTRLIRVPDLQAFREAIVDLTRTSSGWSSASGQASRDDNHASAPGRSPTVVIVPNLAAVRQLERRFDGEPWKTSVRPPALTTRDGLYDLLHECLDNVPRRVTAYEREAMARSAAREANRSNATPTAFGLLRAGLDEDADAAHVRPGTAGEARPSYVAALLRFYDQLRRQGQQVDRFEALLEEALERDAEFDRGAERMLRQTRYLAAAFRGYEQRLAASGGCDEHTLRERLIAERAPVAVRGVIVTVGDWIAEPGGLYQSDFDLLTRLPGLEGLDVVATDQLLRSGFHQRISDWLPGLEEQTFTTPPSPRPCLATSAAAPDRPWITARDREEEVIGMVRRTKTDEIGRAALAYKRPLPYLYLAREVLGGAAIPYSTADAWPLAAEPFAAALDLVFDAVASSCSRAALVALLRSPYFEWADPASPASRESVAALDRALSEARYLGDRSHLVRLAAEHVPDDSPASDSRRRTAIPALVAANAVADELSSIASPAPVSAQIERLRAFLDRHRSRNDDGFTNRERRARDAVVATLDAIAIACRAHDDPPVDGPAVASLVRGWIEEQTFDASAGAAGSGLHLVDDQAARYGDFDVLTIAGLIEGEWPEKPQRNIFYSASLLSALGWPVEKDRRSAAEARFLDLLSSPSRMVILSTITLDDESLVEASPLLEEVHRAGLSTVVLPGTAPDATLPDEILSSDAVDLGPLDETTRAWATLRIARSSASDPAFHGGTGSRPPRAWSVSALETYLECPFKFFAQRVLMLEEEPDDDAVMDPREQGRFVHEVFEKFLIAGSVAGSAE